MQTVSDDGKVFVLGATDGRKKLLLLANTGEEPVEAEFEVAGADTSQAEILMIDDVYHYSPTGKRIVDGKLVLPASSCTEIRM